MTYNSEIHRPAVPNGVVIWVLTIMSPMPKRSIDLRVTFVTNPRAPITTGGMALDPVISQLSSSLF